MVRTVKNFLRLLIVFILSTAVFLAFSYFFLDSSIKSSQKTTDKKTENIPYYSPPENCGLKLLFPNGNSLLIFLDFEREIIYNIDTNMGSYANGSYFGYPVDYKCEFDYYTLSLFFDRIGGIDLESEEGFYHLCGIQICDLLSENNSDDLSFKVISAVFDKIAKNGLSDDDFIFLLDNCKTDLTMPVCLNWRDYIRDLFKNVVFVNRGN